MKGFAKLVPQVRLHVTCCRVSVLLAVVIDVSEFGSTGDSSPS